MGNELNGTIRNRKRARGFTLIEVLFGIFLVMLCATVLAASMPVGDRSRITANNQNVALSLAQKQMEAVRTAGYANLSVDRLAALGMIDDTDPISGNTYSFTTCDNAAVDSPADALPQGNGTITINQIAIDLREVIIEVTWFENGRERTVSLGTMVANL